VRTIDAINIPSSQDTVFRLLALADQWPGILPSLKRVKPSREDAYSRLLKVIAFNGFLPFLYSAIQRQYPEMFRVEHRVVSGIATGMTTHWQVNSVANGSLIQVVNDFGPDAGSPLLKLWHWYVGRVWLRNHSLRVVNDLRAYLALTEPKADAPDPAEQPDEEKIIPARPLPATMRSSSRRSRSKKITELPDS
jgi:hypothetical protein